MMTSVFDVLFILLTLQPFTGMQAALCQSAVRGSMSRNLLVKKIDIYWFNILTYRYLFFQYETDNLLDGYSLGLKQLNTRWENL